MKNIKYLSFLFLFFSVSSCTFGDRNIDPTRPAKANLRFLLPAAEAKAAFGVGDASRYAGIIMQYYDGNDAQQIAFGSYFINETDTDGIWTSFYTGHMSTLKLIMTQATAEKAPHYAGIAKVLMANSLGQVSAYWGDVPYSEAFNAAIVQPKYDTQEKIYQTVQSLLDEAIVDLTATQSSVSPSADDLFYEGDLTKWVKAARALKARYALHLSKVNGNAAYTSALTAINGGLGSNGDDLDLAFDDSDANANPLFQFNRDRPATLIMGNYFYQRLITTSDPRANAHILDDGGTILTGQGTFYSARNSIVPLISFAEQKFIEAEAILMSGGSAAAAETAMQAGIRANIAKVAGSASAASVNAYITANGSFTGLSTNNARLQKIIEQKYMALYTQSEAWTDFRRTGFPAIRPNPGGNNAVNPGGGIPRRLAYPVTEKLLNVNIPTTTPNQQQRFWWDR